MSDHYIPPVIENTTDKTDALDWRTLPDQKCDLNYRPSLARPPLIGSRTVFLLLFVPLVCLPIAYVLQSYTGEAFATTSGFALSAIIGASLALFYHHREFPPKTIALAFVGPSLVWLLIIAMPSHRFAAASILITAAFALPAILWFADAVATHAVHWMSAHYKVNHATMLGWRDDWSQRFTGIPDRKPRRSSLPESEQKLHEAVLAARRAYRDGFIWLPILFLGVSLGLLVYLKGDPRFTLGFLLLFGLFSALVIGCLIRTMRFPGSLRLTWFYFCDWIWHGSFLKQPPWVFQSPSGNLVQRQSGAILVLALAALTLIPLGDYFRWVFLGSFNTDVLPDAVVESPNPFRLASAAAGGNLYVGFLTVLYCFLIFATPGIFLFLITYFLAGPAISAHYAALEAPFAYEQHFSWDRLDGYSERLRSSRNLYERNSIIVGRQLVNDYPVLVHTKLAFEHFHLLGGTGIGKTTLGLMTHLIQLIRRNDGPTIIIDCKGDMALFHTARIEAEKAGRKFKWFTNRMNHSTYIFNPFDKDMYKQNSLQEIVGLLMSALNLHHGSEYGRAWFSVANRVLAKRAFQETVPGQGTRTRFDRIESFKDLNDIILFLAADSKEYQAAQHLAYLIDSLAEFEQLNLSQRTNPNHPATDNAINMRTAIENKEVLYFYLTGAIDSQSTAEIARLAIYSLLMACGNYKARTGMLANASLFVDEAQAVVAQNIAMVLAQARSYGIACFLAHQTMSQLNLSGGADLRELIMGCTCVKQVFSVRDPWLKNYVMEMSGRVRYANFSYQQDARDVMAGLLGPGHAVKNEQGIPVVEVNESTGPGLTEQDIDDYSRDPNICMLNIERAEAFSRWIRFAPIFVDWPLHERDYDDRQYHLPWPESPETITTTSPWPDSPETMFPTRVPTASFEEYKALSDKRLSDLKKSLDDE